MCVFSVCGVGVCVMLVCVRMCVWYVCVWYVCRVCLIHVLLHFLSLHSHIPACETVSCHDDLNFSAVRQFLPLPSKHQLGTSDVMWNLFIKQHHTSVIQLIRNLLAVCACGLWPPLSLLRCYLWSFPL